MTRVMFVDWESLLGEPISHDMMLCIRYRGTRALYLASLERDDAGSSHLLSHGVKTCTCRHTRT
jgi:hypothetical protein